LATAGQLNVAEQSSAIASGDLIDKIIAAASYTKRKSRDLNAIPTQLIVITLAAAVHRSFRFSFSAVRRRGAIGAIKFCEIGG
jgi:hypothetical protein